MGKGDRKSKRGKIFMGSFGASRRRKKNKKVNQVRIVKTKPVVKPVIIKEVVEEPVVVNIESQSVDIQTNQIVVETEVHVVETTGTEKIEAPKKTKARTTVKKDMEKKTEKKGTVKKKTKKEGDEA